MKKYFTILQPPLTAKYRLLVDDISDNGMWGTTEDISMIKYNRQILGEDFDQKISINALFTDKGLTSVFPVGSFIAVLQLKKDESEGKMTFFDYDVKIEKKELKRLIEGAYSENIFKEWYRVFELLQKEFVPSDDLFELYKINF